MKIAAAERVSRFVLIVGLVTCAVTFVEQTILVRGPMDSQLPESVEYIAGTSLGLRDFVVENAKCVLNLFLHPVATVGEMTRAAVHYDETLIHIKNAVDRTLERYPSMSAYEKGRLHSRLLAEAFYMAGVLVVPSLGVAKFDLGAVSQKFISPLTRVSAKNSTSIQQAIGFAEWFAYEN